MKKYKFITIVFFIFGICFLFKPIYFYSKGIFSQYIIDYDWEKFKKTGTNNSNIFKIDVIGKIIIPSVGIKQVILDGTSQRILSFGPGRVKGSSTLESSNNNITLAAHRDSFFQKLEQISINDEIVIEHFNGQSMYQVLRIDIVNKSRLSTYDELLSYVSSVNGNNINQTLTLFTCYPFQFIGSASERFIVTAKKV